MPDDNAKKIIGRFDRLSDARAEWESTWQDISDHILGRRDFVKNYEPGSIRTSKIYDNTGMLAAGLLAGGIHTLMTNSATRWFKMKLEDVGQPISEESEFWIEEVVENGMYTHVNRPEARFMPQLHEVYADISGFGTAGLFVEDQVGRGVRFSSRPLAELYAAENQFGVIDTVFQKVKFTARQAVLEWGPKAGKKANDLLGRGQPEEELEYLRFIRPNDDVVPGRHDFTGMPWASTWLDLSARTTIMESGFHEMPIMIPRWSVDSGETYGRGPGIQALPDQKMLNEMKKTVLTAAQKVTSPPMIADDDGVLTQIRTSPNSVNVVRATSSNREPLRLMPTGNPEVGVELLERERVGVRAAFHFELLQLIQDPRMTATQVLEIANKMQRLLSPILGRLQVELLEPMIERVFGILLRQGRFNPIPAELAGRNIRVEYVSPVARAQKEGDAQAIIDTFTIAANLSQVDQSVLDNLNSDKAITMIAEAKDMPAGIIRSAEEVAEIRRAQAELAKQQADAQEALQVADSAAKLLPALTNAQQGGGAEAA